MYPFQIEFEPRRRSWVLKAHPLINHADLVFGNDSTPGFLGLIGAIDQILLKAKRVGGTIEIRHWSEVSVLHFDPEDVPELATMADSKAALTREVTVTTQTR